MIVGSFEKSITLLLKIYWLITEQNKETRKLRYTREKINLSEDKKKNKILF